MTSRKRWRSFWATRDESGRPKACRRLLPERRARGREKGLVDVAWSARDARWIRADGVPSRPCPQLRDAGGGFFRAFCSQLWLQLELQTMYQVTRLQNGLTVA